jgi:hypothetical protein
MKPRQVQVTLNLVTDEPIKDLRNHDWWHIALNPESLAAVEEIVVESVDANVVKK